MAQMAPALTEATASPESSRKNSVDRHCSSTLQGELKQETSGLGLDLKLVSQNGLVRLISDNNIADISNTIKPSEQNTPIVSRLNGDFKGKSEMPNGHCDDKLEKSATDMSSYSAATEEKRNSSLDHSRTCASTAKTSAGTCNTVSEDEERNRVSQHPVANLDCGKAIISQRTAQTFRRQGKLDGRAKRIETRLRKLQARQLRDHVLQQLENLAEKRGESCDSSIGNLEPTRNSGVSAIPESKSASNVCTELKADRAGVKSTVPGNLATRAKHNSGTTVDNVVKELERISAESFNAGEGNILTDLRQQADAVNSVENWSSQIEFLESIHDSDVTEGSSDEESDEEGELRKTKLRSDRAKLLRRQYHVEEGIIASHWSWLQSQIINVERQIRRYDDLYKGGRLRKGMVKLQACTTNANIARGSNDVDGNGIIKGIKNSAVSVSLEVAKSKQYVDHGKDSPKDPENHVLNGVKRHLLDSSLLNEEDVPMKRYRAVFATNDSTDNKVCGSFSSASNDVFPQCARTRGVYPVRKRRLVHLSHIRQKPKPHSLLCGCVTPTTPCLMCSNSSRTLPVVSFSQTTPERVASLDGSFHPVLSFCTDIPLQLHFGALLQRGGFEKRTKPQVLRSTSQIVEKKKAPVVPKTGKRHGQMAKGTASSLLSSTKLHNQKYERKRGYSVSTPKSASRASESRISQAEGARKKRAAAISAAAQLQKRARSLSLPTVVSSPSTPTSTPSPTPNLTQSMPPASLSSLLKKKKGSNAFDINNIVIPYSMASATRVEKLQYKEIPTPSWRVNDVISEGDELKMEVDHDQTEKEETEDTTDDVYISRHRLCEEQERKRFLGLIKKKRKRTSRQSSEISFSDPQSPLGYPDSQGGTPPGTPICSTPLPTVTGNSLPHSNSFPAAIPYPPASSLSPSATTTTTPTLISSMEKFHRSFSDSKLPHRRSSSTERSEKSLNEEDVWPPVPPWPDRTFPLSESDFSSLKLPTPLPTPASSVPASPSASSPGSPMCSPLASPASDASSEKNEWTVKLVTDQGSSSDTGGAPRKGIVLKLAKR